jgi:hypothetical protein
MVMMLGDKFVIGYDRRTFPQQPRLRSQQSTATIVHVLHLQYCAVCLLIGMEVNLEPRT